MLWLAVALGGAIGSIARHALNEMFARFLMGQVPFATAAVNLAGSLCVGVLAGGIASGRLVMSTPVRAFLFVGILGAFRTFSSFMLDTLTLSHVGDRTLAIGNVLGQTTFGVLAVFLGYALGTWQ